MNLNTRKVRAAAASGSFTLSGVVAAGLLRNLATGWGPIGLAVAVTVAVTVLAAATARYYASSAALFDNVDRKYRPGIARWLTAACLVDGGIIGASLATPNAWMVTTVLAVSSVYAKILFARMQEHYYTELAPRREDMKRQQTEQAKQNGQTNPLTGKTNAAAQRYSSEEEALFYRCARDAKLPFLLLNHHEYLYDVDGTQFGLQYRCEIDPTFDNGARDTPTELGEGDIKRFVQQVNRYMSKIGVRLEEDWITWEPTGVVGEYRININTIDLMKKLRAYTVDEPQLREFSDPVLVSYSATAEPTYLPLGQHGNIAGGTTSGKTSLLNSMIRDALCCATHDERGNPRDGGGLVWLAGRHKFKRTWGEWIEPYLDTDFATPFDFVAYGEQDTADMLAEALRISDHRYKQLRPDACQPAIWIVIDECQYVLRSDKVARYQGAWWTASGLLGQITAATASSGIYVVTSTQHGTHPNYGSAGAMICANHTWASCFRSGDTQEPYRQMGHKAPMPTNTGEFWLKTSGQSTIKGKAVYIQESAKRQLADGEVPTVADVSWNRRHYTRRLDDYSYQATTDVYRKRYTSARDLLEYMSDQKPSPAPSYTEDDEDDEDTVTADDVYDMDMLADLGLGNLAAELRSGVDTTTDHDSTPGKPEPVVNSTTAKIGVDDAIRAVLTDTPGLTSGDITMNVTTSYDFSEGYVRNKLSSLTKRGGVVRSGTAYYLPQSETGRDDTAA